jgi:DNA-binding transcriptional LysR family regulator
MLVEIVLNQTDMVAAMPFSVAQLYQLRGQLAILELALPITMPPVGLLLHAQALHSPSVEAVIRLVRHVGKMQRGASNGPDNFAKV